MKVINIHQQQAHEERMQMLKEQHAAVEAQVESQRPQPMEVERNTGDVPMELQPGFVVMPGDYYVESPSPIVIPASDIGDNKGWQLVDD